MEVFYLQFPTSCERLRTRPPNLKECVECAHSVARPRRALMRGPAEGEGVRDCQGGALSVRPKKRLRCGACKLWCLM